MRRLRAGLTVAIFALAACAPQGEVAQSGEGGGAAAAALHALFDEEWDYQMREFPTWATAAGVHDYNDRLTSMTLADIERRAGDYQAMLGRLHQIDREALDNTDQVSYDMFEVRLEDRIEKFEFNDHLLPIDAEGGFHTSFAMLPTRVPLFNTLDYENYISRLNAYTEYSDQHIEVMREGITKGMVQPQVILEGIEDTITSHIVDDPETSVLWQPFAQFPGSVPEADHERLRQAGRVAIQDNVVPAYQTFLEFMVDEYIPACRDSIGAIELPDGKEYYDYLVRHFTTLDITAEEVHEIGLAEVERIRGEMMEIIEEVGFEGDLQAFLDFLRTDSRFFVDTPEALLKEAAYIAKTMDGKLPALFKTMPRLPYTVEPVPDHIAPKYTTGRYVGAPEGSTRPGIYWVNTYALESRPLWALPALTLHEAVPGHHFQNAISRELDDLPMFRRFSYVNAFGEGWGLYSEWLGVEVGIYEDPYDNFGRLSYEMWRAVRLVVDTGMHAFGWTRQQTLDFMAESTSLSLHEITTETDRYIGWPGQALAYKMGQIKIKELRHRAEEALAEKFDVREFHDVVLLNGTVPLTVLEDQVEAYIERTLAAG